MEKKTDVLGVIIAGGASERMAQDKSTLKHPKAASFLHFSAALFEEIGLSCVVSGPFSGQGPGSLSYILDKKGRQGPLDGLYSVFETYPKHSLLVIPVDMPALNLEILNHIVSKPLKKNSFGRVLACAPQSQNQKDWPFYPFPLLLSPLAIPALQNAIQNKQWALMPFLQSLDLERVPSMADWAPKLINVNTPKDLQAFYDTPGR